jgi:hypothetical protein
MFNGDEDILIYESNPFQNKNTLEESFDSFKNKFNNCQQKRCIKCNNILIGADFCTCDSIKINFKEETLNYEGINIINYFELNYRSKELEILTNLTVSLDALKHMWYNSPSVTVIFLVNDLLLKKNIYMLKGKNG